MEIDLQTAAPPEPIRSHVCIVGGGIAGIVLARRLSAQGIDVVLVEAGGHALRRTPPDATPTAMQAGQSHTGAAEGFLRVYGGSSLRWGGQLMPLLEHAPYLGSRIGWPVEEAELAPFYLQAEALLGVDHLSYEANHFFPEAGLASPALLSGLLELDGRLSKWTPFAGRNLAMTLGRSLLRDPHVRVLLHAQATELHTTRDGQHVQGVSVLAPSGRVLRVEAAQFILAAGTVESVRLLLASRSVSPQGVGNTHGQVGRNFHDHLTVPAASLTGPARERMLSKLRPWVVRRKGRPATVHSAKLVATPDLCAQLDINPILAHLTVEEPEDGGIAAVRGLLRGRQSQGLSAAVRTHAGRLPMAVSEGVRLLWAARFDRRRYVSARARVQLYLSAAQDAPSASRISLSRNLDASGMPLPCIDWRISSREMRSLARFTGWLQGRFTTLGLQGIDWEPALLRGDADVPAPEDLAGFEDNRHAMGGACMGLHPRSSVVDAHLAVHGVDNLFIASAATFPNGSAQLPALPLMALVLRLADHLSTHAQPPAR